MKKIIKIAALIGASIVSIVFVSYAAWCLHENYKAGEWSESCGLVITNPHYRECKQRRVWVPKDIDLSAGLKKPKFDPNAPYEAVTLEKSAFKTMWVIVDPFQEYGGTFVDPAPSVPENIRNHPCAVGSWFFHKKYQWVCVESVPQSNLPRPGSSAEEVTNEEAATETQTRGDEAYDERAGTSGEALVGRGEAVSRV